MADTPHPRKRTAEPSKGDERLFRAHTGPRRDVGPVRRVSYVAIGPVQPSPPSRCHPRHCSAHPRRCGSAGRQAAAAPAAVPRTASRQLHPRVSTRETTEQKNPMLPHSKPLLGGYRARHSAPTEVRFTRTAVYSTALYATPPHVGRIVRYACKLPPPWPIKGGAVPWPQGDDGQCSLARFLPSPRYWHLASIKP
jgi:hypothetical protein